MLKVTESKVEFIFKVKAYNYDDRDSVYEKNRFCGVSAVDFLILPKQNIYFMEVKNAKYFSVKPEELSDKICKIYKKFIDSIALVSLSHDKELRSFKIGLKNRKVKLILFVTDKLPPDLIIIYYEKIKKQLTKKLKRLNNDMEFILSTQDKYNDKFFDVKIK